MAPVAVVKKAHLKRSNDENQSKLHKRCTWLGAHAFGNKTVIDEEAIFALSRLDFGRAMEITKELEAKAGAISNPSGYIKTVVRRELSGGDAKAVEGIHKRCTWLGANIYGEKTTIDEGAITSLCSVPFSRAMEITKELEEKGDSVKNPSAYIFAAVRRDHGNIGEDDMVDEQQTLSSIHKRCTWLGANIFGNPKAIDEKAIVALTGLKLGRAMEITKEVQEKASSIKNPSAYIQVAVQRELSLGFGNVLAPLQLAPSGKADDQSLSAMHKRCTWLGANVFGDKQAIDQDAIAALASIPFEIAMEITKELQAKGSSVKNPSAYLQTAVQREIGSALGALPVPVDDQALSSVHKRCTWLGANVFGAKTAINQEAINALATLSVGRALEITKQLEEKGATIKNPSGYLINAVKINAGGGGAPAAGAGGEGQSLSTIHKRCTWLGANVFGDKNAIDSEAIAALSRIDLGHAMQLTKDLQEKGANIKNPSGYLKAAVKQALKPAPY